MAYSKKKKSTFNVDAARARAKNKDKEDYIRNLYNESVDRDAALQRAYKENRAVSNEFATQTRGMQDRLSSVVKQNKSFIKNTYGSDTYKALRDNAKAMRSTPYRKYYASQTNTSEYKNRPFGQQDRRLGLKSQLPYGTKLPTSYTKLQSDLAQDEKEAGKEFRKAATKRAGEYVASAFAAMGGGNAQELQQQYNNSEYGKDMQEKAENLSTIQKFRKYYYDKEKLQPVYDILDNNRQLTNLVAKAYEEDKANKKRAKDIGKETTTKEANAYSNPATAFINARNEALEVERVRGDHSKTYREQIEEMGYDASELINAYKIRKDAEEAAKFRGEVAAFTKEAPYLAIPARIATQALQVEAAPEVIASGIKEQVTGEYAPLNYNDESFAATQFRENVDETMHDILTKNAKTEKGKKIRTFLYDTGMSMGDFLSLAPLGAISEAIPLFIMGTSAGVSAAKEATERGLDASHAMWTAVAAGAAEALFEKVSLEKLFSFDGSTLAKKIASVFKQSFTEGSEEVFTDVANAMTDYFINANEAELVQRRDAYIEQYKKKGLSAAEAKKKADEQIAKDFAMQLLESGLAGAVSGGVSAGGMAAASTLSSGMQYNSQLNDIGRDIKGTGRNTDILTLVTVANKVGVKSDVTDMFNKYGDVDLDVNDEVSNKAVGKLYSDTLTEIDKQFYGAKTLGELTEKLADVTEAVESSAKGDVIPASNFTQAIATMYTGAAMEIASREENAEFEPQSAPEKAVETEEAKAAIKEETAKSVRQNSINATAEINGTPIKVTSIASVDDDIVTFNTSDGKTVTLKELGSSSGLEEIVNDMISLKPTVKLNANGANELLSAIIKKNVPTGEYNDFIENAKSIYSYGLNGVMKLDTLLYSSTYQPMVKLLGEDVVRTMYSAGVSDRSANTTAKDRLTDTDRSNNVELEEQPTGEFVNETGKEDLGLVGEMLTKKLGLDMYIGSTNPDVNGELKQKRGKGFIYEGSLRGETHAIGHEMIGEVLRAYNRKDYNAIVDAIIEYATTMTDADYIAARIQDYYDNYLVRQKGTTIEDAREEFANDLIAALMTGNEHAQQQFVDWLVDTQDKSFAEKVKELIAKIIAALNKYLNTNALSRAERAMVNADIENANRLATQITEALKQAEQNIKQGNKIVDENGVNANTVTELADNGVLYDEETQSLNKFDESKASMKFATEGAWENPTSIGTGMTYKEALLDAKTKTNIASGNYKTEAAAKRAAQKWVNDAVKNEGILLNYYVEIFGLPQVDADGNLVTPEYEAIDERAIKKDSDYPQGTIDFNNDCPKRALFTKIVDEFLFANPNVKISANTITQIRESMAKRGYTVACGLCYVEDRRQQTAQIAEDFIKLWDGLKDSGKPLTKTSSTGKVTVLHASQIVADKYGLKKGQEFTYKAKADGTPITQYDLNSLSGFLKLQRENPQIAAAFEQYNNSRGQQAARLLLGRSEYNREILSWSDDKVKQVNDNGGLRIFSFSDFEVVHMLDIMQILMDCEAKGVKIQGYTKQSAFATFVAETGLKLNRSFIPMNAKDIDADYKGDGYHYDEEYINKSNDAKLKKLFDEYKTEFDAKEEKKSKRRGFNRRYDDIYKAEKALVDYIIDKGHLDAMPMDFDGKEGIGGNDSEYLKNSTDNVGNIVIGVNDFQIRRAMADDRIHFIIPFHSNKKADTNKRLGVGTWWNYKNYQVDKWQLTSKEAEALGIKQGKAEDVNLYTEVIEELQREGKRVTERNVFDRFIQKCNELGKKPRFDYFINSSGTEKNAKTGKNVPKYQFTKGYYKLLVDFKLFDTKTGRYLPQQVVNGNNVDMDSLIKKINGELEGELAAHGKDTKISALELMAQQLQQKNPDMTQAAAQQQAEADLKDIVNLIGKAVKTDVAMPDIKTGGRYDVPAEIRSTDINATTDAKHSIDVTDKETLDFLENQPKETVYRAMQYIDGKLYPPMAAIVEGQKNGGTEIGRWEYSEERPDLIVWKNGKAYFKLNKGNGSSIYARYNPYFHTSRSPLNDQFSSAYKRPNIVIVEGEVPSSELTSNYRAEHAKDAVGEMKWHSGSVSSKLKGEKARRVILTRWFKPTRVVPDTEVADVVAKMLEGENIDVPYNVVTPSLRAELEKRGVNIVGENNDIRFSVDIPVEETKDLIAVHNLRENELLSSLALGGMPMPSVAVMRAENSRNNSQYGDISLVFPKEAIDPKRNRNNKLYGGDAWTPTFPTVEYKLNDKKAWSIYDRVRDITAPFMQAVQFHPENLQRAIQRKGSFESYLNNLKHGQRDSDYGMKQLFLKETTGEYVPMQQETQREELSPARVEEFNYFIDKMGLDTLRENYMDGIAWYDEHGDEFRKVYEEWLGLHFPNASAEANADTADKLRGGRINMMRHAILDYADNGAVKEKTVDDEAKTKALIDEKINAEEYDKWLNDMFDGLVEKEGLRNDKDAFTPAGNRRSWESLHYEYTLENIVKEMRQHHSKGASLLGGGFWGAATKDYSSIEEMRNDKSRLNYIDIDDYEAIRQGYEDRYVELQNIMMSAVSDKPYYEYDGFTAAQIETYANELMINGFSNAKTKSGLKAYWQQNVDHPETITDAYVDDFVALANDISNMPTGYFEAKPERAVKFNEVYTAVIPDNASAELTTALDNAGVKYEMYKTGDEDARVEVLNSLEDVKFSVDVTENDTSSLVAENAELQKTVDYLKMMLGRNTERKVNRKRVHDVAVQLRKSWNTTLTSNEIADKLTELYDYISKGEDVVWDEVRKRGMEIAKDIVTNEKPANISDENKAILKDLKTYDISISDAQRSEIKYYYGSVANWLNTIRRGVHYTTNGMTLDEAWGELSSKYPYLFDPETNSQDQPMILADAIASLYDTSTENDYGVTDDELAEMLMYDIYDKYFDIPEIKTPLDKADAKLNKERIENRERLEAVRSKLKENYNQKLRAAKAELNEKWSDKLKQQRIDTLAKAKAKYEGRTKSERERRERSKTREKLRRLKKAFDKNLLHPTDNMYVPEYLVNAVIDVCDMLTESERFWKNGKPKPEATQLRLDTLKTQYDKLRSETNADYVGEYDEDFSKLIEALADELRGKQLTELTANEMERVYQTTRVIYDTLRSATRQIGLEERISNYKLAIEVMRQTLASDGYKNRADQVAHAYESYVLNPMRYIRMITEYDENATLRKMFDALEQGVYDTYRFYAKAMRPFLKLRNGDNLEKFNKFITEEKDYGIKDTDGKPVLMTEAQALQLYMTAQREEGFYHIQNGGAVITDTKLQSEGQNAKAKLKGKKVAKYQGEAVLNIGTQLSEYGKEWLKESRHLFDDVAKDAINKTSMQLKHRKLATGNNYIHIEVNNSELNRELEGLVKNATLEGSGNLKATVKNAGQGVIIRGISNVVDNQISFVSKYSGLAVPIRNFNKVYNGKASKYFDEDLTEPETMTVKKALEQKWGANAIAVIESVLEDLQSSRGANVKTNDYISKIFGTVRSGFVVATLAGNIQVAIKQAASYPTAAAILSWNSLLKGLNGFAGGQKLWDEIDEHTGIHFMRRQGYTDTEIGDLTVKNGKAAKFVRKLPTAINPMKWIQGIDVATTAALWSASKAEVEATTNYKVGSQQYWDAVTDLYESVITETQPNYDVLHRPEVQKETNELVKAAVMFKTQPLQNTGILYGAANELKQMERNYKKNASEENAAALRAAKTKLAKAVMSQAVSMTVFVAMTLLGQVLSHRMYGFRDDDDEVTTKSVLAGFLRKVIEYAITDLLPIGSATAIAAYEKFIEKSSFDVTSVPTAQMINDLFDDISKVIKATENITDADKKSGETAKLIFALGNLLTKSIDVAGLPASNLYKSAKGIVYYIIDAADENVKLFETSDKTFTDPVNTKYTQMFNAADEGRYQDAEKLRGEIVELKVKEGLDEKTAKQRMRTAMTKHFKPLYLKGDANKKSEITAYLTKTKLYGDNRAETVKKLAKWE